MPMICTVIQFHSVHTFRLLVYTPYSVLAMHTCDQYLLTFHSHQGGFTALYCACQEGHERTVQLLIQARANLDLQDNVS